MLAILGMTPASTVRLEDFTLTRMDRPHHVYTMDGELVIKTPNGNQSDNHSNITPAKGKRRDIVRTYVHSDGHYALPIDMEPFNSKLMRAPSTEELVNKGLMAPEFSGIDNPSFSGDDLLDSGNESDRISDAKQDIPKVSPERMTSQAVTSTLGGVSHNLSTKKFDTVAQENNKMSEAFIRVPNGNEPPYHDNRSGRPCHPDVTGKIFGTSSLEGGSITGVGALGLTVQRQNAIVEDYPPPLDFATPLNPATPPALRMACHSGSDTASDSGAASAKQSTTESPTSSELGETKS